MKKQLTEEEILAYKGNQSSARGYDICECGHMEMEHRTNPRKEDDDRKYCTYHEGYGDGNGASQHHI